MEKSAPNTRPLIARHFPCMDGMGAWLKLKDEADCVKADYGVDMAKLIPQVQGRDVHMIDVSYPEKKMRELASACKSLTVIDHHAFAERALANIPSELCQSAFDQKKSAAPLSCAYFNPGNPIPRLSQYLEDHDLWKFELPDSEELCLWIQGKPLTLESFKDLVDEFEDETPSSAAIGFGQGGGHPNAPGSAPRKPSP